MAIIAVRQKQRSNRQKEQIQFSQFSSLNDSSTSEENTLQASANFDNQDIDDDNFGGFPDDEDYNDTTTPTPLETILDNFTQYINDSFEQNCQLNSNEVRAINLMTILRKTKAPLSTYERIMDWHFKDNGDIPAHAPVSDCSKYITNDHLLRKLISRYNMEKKVNIVKEIILPYTGSKTKIVINNAEWCIQSLLTHHTFKLCRKCTIICGMGIERINTVLCRGIRMGIHSTQVAEDWGMVRDPIIMSDYLGMNCDRCGRTSIDVTGHKSMRRNFLEI